MALKVIRRNLLTQETECFMFRLNPIVHAVM